ncbi:MAG TPA: glycosyltransferase [Myxococcales bacterium]|nr:glycosyltransferase [Myxococcales bacterium]
MTIGIKNEQIHIIPPFVHDLPATSVQNKDRILFVGRLTRAKGVHAAVAAWKKSGLTLPLVFAGTGSERNALERAGFEVTGWLDRSELAEQYARAATIVMPSYWQEPYGIVGLEAASLGISVVTWKSGGTLEWSEAENTVEWGDIDALAERLKKAATESPTPQSLVNPSNVMAELLTLYQDVIHEHNEG